MKKVELKVNKREKTIYGIISASVVIIVWWVVVAAFQITAIPSPDQVLLYFFYMLVNPIGKYTLLVNLAISLLRVFIGYVLAAVFGILFGFLMAISKSFKAAFNPIFSILRPIPPLAWIPLAILWFGLGETPKYFLIFMCSFIPFCINAYTGASKVDPQLIGAAKALGANEKQVITKVIIPSSVPQVFTGAQVALSSAWMTVLGAELVSSTEGAGWLIIAGMEMGNIKQMIVGMLAIGLTGATLALTMRIFERRFLAWNIRGR